jgi:hypothetical protein
VQVLNGGELAHFTPEDLPRRAPRRVVAERGALHGPAEIGRLRKVVPCSDGEDDLGGSVSGVLLQMTSWIFMDFIGFLKDPFSVPSFLLSYSRFRTFIVGTHNGKLVHQPRPRRAEQDPDEETEVDKEIDGKDHP